MKIRSAPALALLATGAQILLLVALSPAHGLSERYRSLNNWDSFHYQRIAESGYQIPAGEISSEDIHAGHANVVFFPGYPMASRMVARLTGLEVPFAQLVLAHVSAFLFWLYFFLLFDLNGVSARARLLCASWALVHPAAFFLVAGYTESLFLFGMMGFLYWSERWLSMGNPEKASEGGNSNRIVPAFMSALHGGVMSFTRIVSFAPAAYPSFVELSKNGLGAFRRARFWCAVALSSCGVVGAIVFFAYCQSRFHEWSLYFRLEELGWQNHRLWFAVLNPLSYMPHFFFEHSIDSLNRLAVLVTGVMLAVTAYSVPHWKREWPLWSVAFFLFYIALTGKANANMDSMLRYTFPPFILLLLFWAKNTGAQRIPDWRRGWIFLVAGLSLGFQIWCAIRFLRGRWVA